MNYEKVVKMPEVPKKICNSSCNNTKCNIQAVAEDFRNFLAESGKSLGQRANLKETGSQVNGVLTL